MNWSAINLICYEQVCYERGLFRMACYERSVMNRSVLNGYRRLCIREDLSICLFFVPFCISAQILKKIYGRFHGSP